MNRTTDWFDIEPFGEHDTCLTEGGDTLPINLYLLAGEDDALVVDAGLGVGDLRATASELVDTDVRLFLTHTHWDHIGAGSQFDRVTADRREVPDDGRVTIDTLTDEFVDRPPQFAGNYRDDGGSFPDDFDVDTYTLDPIPDVEPVDPGDVIDLGGRTLEVVDLAGHSPGHVGLLERERDVLHGGDLVHFGLGMYLHFVDCDAHSARASLGRAIELRDEGAYETLTTCHNPPLSGDELGVLDRLHEGVGEIIDGTREGERVETNYGPANQYLIGESEVFTKPSV